MDEPIEPPEIDLDAATFSALRRRGANLYIWADDAGMLRARTTPPAESVSYDTFSAKNCSIHVDQGIIPRPAARWRIRWKRLPWPHFVAVLNADTTGDAIAGLLGGWWYWP